MNEDVFNTSLRRFLKKVGITSQREIEMAVREAVASGRLKGHEKLPAKMVLTFGGVSLSHEISGRDRTGLSGDDGARPCPVGCGPASDLPDGSNFRISENAVQPLSQKYSDFQKTQISLYPWPSRPTEGRLAIVTDAGRDAVDADGADNERR